MKREDKSTAENISYRRPADDTTQDNSGTRDYVNLLRRVIYYHGSGSTSIFLEIPTSQWK